MLTVAEKKLVDLSSVSIAHAVSKEERIKKYIEDIGDPYNFKVGDMEVSVSFESDGESLQRKMEKYFETMII